MYRVELSHNFETAHRLSTPDSPKKCQSIHGHSWWATVTIEGSRVDDSGILVEFGAFKKAWRTWLDTYVDHALLLHEDDPVAGALHAVVPDMRLLLLPSNPTTEVIARLLYDKASELLHGTLNVPLEWARVRSVHVQETRVNAAAYEPRGD